MTVSGKVWLFLVVLAAMAAFYLTARTLKTHKTWREHFNEASKRVDQASDKIEGDLTAEEGAEAEIRGLEREIAENKVELHKAMTLRGRAWRFVRPGPPSPEGLVNVIVQNPSPHNIEANTVLYVFDTANAEPTQYLGEFKVTAVQDQQITLTPTMNFQGSRSFLKDAFVQRLRDASNNDWSLYDVLPVDSYAAFEGMSEDNLRQLFAGAEEDFIQRFVRDGQEAQPDDPEDRVVTINGKRIYRRPLRDYAVLLRDLDKRITVLIDEIASRSRDVAYMQAANADAQKDREFRAAEVQRLEADKAEAERELAAVTAHEQRLEAELEQVRQEVDKLFNQNKMMAEEIARRQREAVEQRESPAATAHAQLEPQLK